MSCRNAWSWISSLELNYEIMLPFKRLLWLKRGSFSSFKFLWCIIGSWTSICKEMSQEKLILTCRFTSRYFYSIILTSLLDVCFIAFLLIFNWNLLHIIFWMALFCPIYIYACGNSPISMNYDYLSKQMQTEKLL